MRNVRAPAANGSRPPARWLLAVFLFYSLAGCGGPPKLVGPTKCILFIGNSLTYVNDLPHSLARLAASGGHPLVVDSYAPGGWQLHQDADSAEALAKIASRPWDFVVLQEQSEVPAIPQDREGLMYPAVRTLNGKIREAGSQTLLFLTWGRKNGDVPFGYPDYESMQDGLTAGYEGIAKELGIPIVPAGPAWKAAHAQRPDLELWSDDRHPSPAGTYLAACVFYSFLYRQSTEGLGYRMDLPRSEAQFIQRVAAGTVLGVQAP